MNQSEAEQPAFEGMASRHRRRRPATKRMPAGSLPIAQVILDVQATHLGTTFDYLVDEHQTQNARPGAMVRVRFGGRRVNGIIWARVQSSQAPKSSLRYIERILTPHVLMDREMRDDVRAIADMYGGTRANIVRLALPSRVARVDAEPMWVKGDEPGGPRSLTRSSYKGLPSALQRFEREYDRSRRLLDAVEGSGGGDFILDMLPGQMCWAYDLAALALDAMVSGKAVVLVMPGMRETAMMEHALQHLGLRPFPYDIPVHSTPRGDYLVLSAALPPEQRYRAYCAVASGGIGCVVGPRAAMYAPVKGPALFAIVEDVAYQNADGMMPYANARGVLRLRAASHHGVFLAMAHARSAVSQEEAVMASFVHRDGPATTTDAVGSTDTGVMGPSIDLHPLPAVVKGRAPWIRWLNRDELTRLADPTVGARVPHFAVRIIKDALTRGPVLLSIPQDGTDQIFGCTRCHHQARCMKCTGPLFRASGAVPRCGWCGAPAVNWRCPHCGNERMVMVHVGAAGTAEELHRLFGDVPMVLSGQRQPHGIVSSVPHRPMIVIASPGAEPLVMSSGVSHDGSNAGSSHVDTTADVDEGYEAVAILDAWTSLYARGVDARIDTLNAWMKAVSLCLPRDRGGQALLIGESDPVLARSLVMWDSRQLAMRELEERRETALPPTLPCACVWGRRDAVQSLLHDIGVLDADRAIVKLNGHDVPAVLGPVPIAPPTTMDAHELEETRDRVKAIVRVPMSYRNQFARDLRDAVARHVASHAPGELRFQLDPKDLL